MSWKGKAHVLGFVRQTKGAAAVELALVGTIFLLLVGGAVDFGHAWYMRQVITNASREGARYGITYQTDGNGNRIAPSTFTTSPPTISNYVLTSAGYNLTSLLPSDAAPTVTCPTAAGPGYLTGTKGQPIQVQVTAVKHWFIISGFIPGFGRTKTLTASTIMLCE